MTLYKISAEVSVFPQGSHDTSPPFLKRLCPQSTTQEREVHLLQWCSNLATHWCQWEEVLTPDLYLQRFWSNWTRMCPESQDFFRVPQGFPVLTAMGLNWCFSNFYETLKGLVKNAGITSVGIGWDLILRTSLIWTQLHQEFQSSHFLEPIGKNYF